MTQEEINNLIALYQRRARHENQIATVFLTTHKRPQLLLKMIESLLKQTVQNFQIVVLDNMSQDETARTVSSISNERILYIERESKPPLSNFAFAFVSCATKYLFVVHDDDTVEPGFVETLVNTMELHSDLDALGCGFSLNYSNGSEVSANPNYTSGLRVAEGNEFLLGFFDRGCQPKVQLVFPAIIYRSESFHNISVFLDSRAGPSSDLYFFFQIGRYGRKLGSIPQVLYHYRIGHMGQDSVLRRPILGTTLFSFMFTQDYYRPILVPYRNWIGHFILLSAKDTLCAYHNVKGVRGALRRNYKTVNAYMKRGLKNRARCAFYRFIILFPTFGERILLWKHPEWK